MSTSPAPLWEPIKIVYGVYQLNGPFLGADRWWIQRLVESEEGWMVHNDIYLDQPTRRYITLDVELGEGWEWRYLNLRDDAGQMLAAEVEPGRLVVEHDGQEWTFPFDAESELDFLSPFMNTLTLRRLNLQPGQSVTRPTVWFDPETFAPRLVQQRYTRGADVEFKLGDETIPVQEVTFHHEEGDFHATLLVRADGLVLHYPGWADLDPDERASGGRGRMPELGKPFRPFGE